MDPINKLSALFAQFPGIGSRQSKRFVYFLLKQNRGYLNELVLLIESLKNEVSECGRCHRFFIKKHDKAKECSICIDPNRSTATLLIIEKDSDLEAMERSGTYQGLYFVLGGILPILEKDPGSKIRIDQLKLRIKNDGDVLKEVILACAFTPESEHTAEYVRETLSPLIVGHDIKLTTLGRGLSTGTELEYSDAETLRYALEGRK